MEAKKEIELHVDIIESMKVDLLRLYAIGYENGNNAPRPPEQELVEALEALLNDTLDRGSVKAANAYETAKQLVAKYKGDK